MSKIEEKVVDELNTAVEQIKDRTAIKHITLNDVTYEVDPLKTHKSTSEVLMYLQLFKQSMIVDLLHFLVTRRLVRQSL